VALYSGFFVGALFLFASHVTVSENNNKVEVVFLAAQPTNMQRSDRQIADKVTRSLVTLVILPFLYVNLGHQNNLGDKKPGNLCVCTSGY
jgi:hypothetical protein